jgi:hypothetical protein
MLKLPTLRLKVSIACEVDDAKQIIDLTEKMNRSRGGSITVTADELNTLLFIMNNAELTTEEYT